MAKQLTEEEISRVSGLGWEWVGLIRFSVESGAVVLAFGKATCWVGISCRCVSTYFNLWIRFYTNEAVSVVVVLNSTRYVRTSSKLAWVEFNAKFYERTFHRRFATLPAVRLSDFNYAMRYLWQTLPLDSLIVNGGAWEFSVLLSRGISASLCRLLKIEGSALSFCTILKLETDL